VLHQLLLLQHGIAALARRRPSMPAGAAAAATLKRRAADAPAAPPPPPQRRARAPAAASAPAAPSAAAPLAPYRVEYGAAGPPSSAALASFLSRHRGRIAAVHVANKDAGDRLLERAEALLSALGGPAAAAAAAPPPSSFATEVCLHYSLKLQGGRGDEAVRRLSAFLERAARLGGGGGDGAGGGSAAATTTNPRCCCSVLLVSGSGDPSRRPKGQLCAAEALERLAAERASKAAAGGGEPPPPLPRLYVAFNPYFPDPRDRERERARLRRKLDTGLVTGGVALQFGADPELLAEGLAFLRQAAAAAGTAAAATLVGSVFLPTKRFLAQMRFRPWRGVFLSEEGSGGFLDSTESAERRVAAVLRVYARWGVVPLVETALAVDDDEEEGGEHEKAKQNSLAAAEALLRRGGVTMAE